VVVSELPIGQDGFVDMDAFPSADPDESLAPGVYERLHDVLVSEPVPVPSGAAWDRVVDWALEAPADVDTDWLVSADVRVADVDGDAIFGSEVLGLADGVTAQTDVDWLSESSDDDATGDWSDGDWSDGSDDGDPDGDWA
jgi:hypothetical protein